MIPEACVVMVTCGNADEAARIAEAVVTERLAACVNVLGGGQTLQSFYCWEGSLQREPEILLLIKTRPQKLAELESRIQTLHSYSVPEFIVLPVLQGSQAYMAWLTESVQ